MMMMKILFESVLSFFSNRYQSESQARINVTDGSSTYLEFKLKRLNFDEQSWKFQQIYNQTKDFVLHRRSFLFVLGICG